MLLAPVHKREGPHATQSSCLRGMLQLEKAMDGT